MPETAILNPTPGQWDEDLQDNMCPDYGWQRDRPTTRAVVKPAGGQPWSRETSNSGHSFSFSWLNRSERCVRRIKQFAEQFEDGFFTIVDWDYGASSNVPREAGDGRHYVGRFTASPQIVQTGNDRYSIQGLAFEEVPGVPMVQYPSDWENDSILCKAVNDFGDIMPAISGTWAQQVVVNADEGTQSIQLTNPGNVGEFVTYEYRGYGFRLWMGSGPDKGQVQVLLDGVVLNNSLDLYAAQDQGLQMVLDQGEVPLNFHRVKVVALGQKGGAATAANVTWGFLEVMR